MVMTPEGKIKAKVKAMLKEFGAWQFWPVSNGMGMHGVPDCIVCYKGRFASIETKAAGKKPTPLQEMQGHNIKVAGGLWFVVDGDETLALLREWLECAGTRHLK